MLFCLIGGNELGTVELLMQLNHQNYCDQRAELLFVVVNVVEIADVVVGCRGMIVNDMRTRFNVVLCRMARSPPLRGPV